MRRLELAHHLDCYILHGTVSIPFLTAVNNGVLVGVFMCQSDLSGSHIVEQQSMTAGHAGKKMQCSQWKQLHQQLQWRPHRRGRPFTRTNTKIYRHDGQNDVRSRLLAVSRLNLQTICCKWRCYRYNSAKYVAAPSKAPYRLTTPLAKCSIIVKQFRTSRGLLFDRCEAWSLTQSRTGWDDIFILSVVLADE